MALGVSAGVLIPTLIGGAGTVYAGSKILDSLKPKTPKTPELPQIPTAPPSAQTPTLAGAHQTTNTAATHPTAKAMAGGTIGAGGPQGLVDKAQTTNLTLLGGSR